eukprot:UN00003
MQRSLSLLRRMNGIRIVHISQLGHNKSILQPQYIAIRKYVNPDGDYMELSETAWKEKRLYRYYKFSNNLSVTQQGKGYAAGLYVIAGFLVMFFVVAWIDIETCVQYRRFRTIRKEITKPWLTAAAANGFWTGWGYSKSKLNEMYDTDLPQIAKKHDAPTRREWQKEMCLAQCIKREKEFDSPYHFNNVDNAMPPNAHPAYHAFVENEKAKKGIAQLD